MKFRKKTAAILCALALFSSFVFCASTKKVSKESIDRRVVIGKAIHADSTEVDNAMVSLFDVRIIRDHDSIFNTYSTNTGRSGCFVLQGVPDGEYLLYVYDVNRGKCDLSRIQKQQNSFQLTEAVLLKSLVTLKGQVINTGSNSIVKVIIPGFGASSVIDNEGFYVLTDVPGGFYKLAFIGEKTVGYLQVNITDEVSDTVFLKDFDAGYYLISNRL